MTVIRTMTQASNPRSNMFEARVAHDQMGSTTMRSFARRIHHMGLLPAPVLGLDALKMHAYAN